MSVKREAHKKRKPDTAGGILLTLAVFGAEFLMTALYLWPKSLRGELIPVRRASEDLPAAFRQGMIPFLIPLCLFLLFAALLKRDFPVRMYLRLDGKWQRIAALVLAAGILGLTAYCLIVKENRITVLFSLFYYVVFVGFGEEFVCRDVCTDFLRNAPRPIRYLVPNLCFAMLHLFERTGWGTVTGADLVRFLTADLAGLTVSGCLFQLFKERSGTIWLSVLLHALMDYSVVLTY